MQCATPKIELNNRPASFEPFYWRPSLVRHTLQADRSVDTWSKITISLHIPKVVNYGVVKAQEGGTHMH